MHHPRTAGAVQGALMGLVYGTIFMCTKRILLAMIVHAAFDVAAVLMIFRRVEIPIAESPFN